MRCDHTFLAEILVPFVTSQEDQLFTYLFFTLKADSEPIRHGDDWSKIFGKSQDNRNIKKKEKKQKFHI